ncbi:glycoside hydrolase family 3 N-terminal domain-containing protein [Azospirillum formosense]|uniref:glycoside hydrolase family 3 N-terminal domain-containing protein n=1 Tax=Azospirillum formosense TaxID=861533 RepID=UPI00338EA33E
MSRMGTVARTAMALAVPVALWLGGALTLLAALAIRTPYLFSIRSWALAAVLCAGALGVALASWRLPKGRRPLGWLLIALCAAGPAVALAMEGRFLLQKQRVLAARGAMARDIGRHLMVGYGTLADIEPLAANGLIGGIFVTRSNIAARSAEGLRADIARLQALRREAGLPPLAVAADQEGGIVSRLSPPLTALPPLGTLADQPADQRRAAALAYGAVHGQELAGLGVTINFTPVVDLRTDDPAHPLDFGSQIARRAISDNPAIVTEVAVAYGEALRQAGVTPTLKHFPGLGGVAEDTHIIGATLHTPTDALERRDWRPFRETLGRLDAWLMVGHATLAAVDPQAPASLSRPVVGGLLRGNWGFRGIIVTDDMTMGAVFNGGLCRGAVAALNAGVDILLVSYDWEQTFPALDCLIDAGRDGRLDSAALARSRHRLDAGRLKAAAP